MPQSAIRARSLLKQDAPNVVQTNELRELGITEGAEVEIIPFQHKLRIYYVQIAGEFSFAQFCPHCVIETQRFNIGGELYRLDKIKILYELRVRKRAPLRLVSGR